MPITKSQDILYLKGVGPKRAEAFKKLGINTVSDLFTIYPRDYIHNSKISKLKEFRDANVLILAEIADKREPKRQNHPMKLLISDDSGEMECLVWGNFYYRQKQFQVGDKYLIWGKVTSGYYDQIQFDIRDHKKYEASDDALLKFPFIPVYILSGELKKNMGKTFDIDKNHFHCA